MDYLTQEQRVTLSRIVTSAMVEGLNNVSREVPLISALSSSIEFKGNTLYKVTPFCNTTTHQEQRSLSQTEFSQLKLKANAIVSEFNNRVANKGLTFEEMQFAKTAFVYKYLANNVKYDYRSVYTNADGSTAFGNNLGLESSAYGALVLGKAVCGGIREAGIALCALLELEAKGVISSAGNHAYYVVKRGNEWHRCDPTNAILYGSDNLLRADSVKVPRDEIAPPDFADFVCSEVTRESISEMERTLANKGVDLNFVEERPQISLFHNSLKDAVETFVEQNNLKIEFRNPRLQTLGKATSGKSEQEADKLMKILHSVDKKGAKTGGARYITNSTNLTIQRTSGAKSENITAQRTDNPDEPYMVVRNVNYKITVFGVNKNLTGFNKVINSLGKAFYNIGLSLGIVKPKIKINRRTDDR